MTGGPPNLPPELLRSIASYMKDTDLLKLIVSSRYFSWLFEDIYPSSWTVNCCRDAKRKISIDYPKGCYVTNLDLFYRGVKNGLAPAYAKIVCFEFCKHDRHLEDHLQSPWPLENTAKLFKMLNASEIMVSLREPYPKSSYERMFENIHDDEIPYICNEPLIEVALCESLRALPNPNAIVKLRMERVEENWSIVGESYYFTLRDSSTSPVAADNNLQRALRTIRHSFLEHDLWDTSEFHSIYSIAILRIFPNVKHLNILYSFTFLNPEGFLVAFPRCERLTGRWHKSLLHAHCVSPEATFYFDSILESADERRCTKISVHCELYKWIHEVLHSGVILEHVKVLEFHHARYEVFLEHPSFLYTPARILCMISSLLSPFPNLEKVTLKFCADTKLVADSDFLVAGLTLTKELCPHCKLNVNVLDF